MRAFGINLWRRESRIDQGNGVRCLEALVPRVPRTGERLRPHVVIGEDRRKQVRRRNTHAVEQGERAVAMPEQAQHRHHAIDRVEELRG